STPAGAANLSQPWAFLNVTVSDSRTISAFIDFNRSLVGYWRFQEGDSGMANDTSTWGNNGTLTGFGCMVLDCNASAGWTSAGRFGKALTFDGSANYVNAGNSSSLMTSQNFTIEAWIKIAESGAANGIASKSNTSASYGEGWYLLVNSSAVLDFGIYNASYDYRGAVTTASLSNNTWHHVVGTYNGSYSAVYVDGNLQARQNVGIFLPSSRNLTIGGWQHGSGNYFNGTIDEVRLWNRTLSAAEINTSFNAGRYPAYRNFTGLADGAYNYYAYATDDAGNANRTPASGFRTFAIDTVVPGVTNPQANISSVNFTQGMNINVTVTDAGTGTRSVNAGVQTNNVSMALTTVAGVWAINTTPQVLGCASNATTCIITFNATDFAGNNNATTLLSIATNGSNSVPSATLTSPANNANTSNTRPTFTYAITDPDSGQNLSSVVFVQNGSSVFAIGYNVTASPASSVEISNQSNMTLADGNYTWWVTITDGTGTANSSLRVVIVDTVMPTVTSQQVNVTTPVRSNFALRFNVTVIDATSGVFNVTLGTLPAQVKMIAIGSNVYELNATLTSLGCSAGTEANCSLIFNATDFAGNSNANEKINVTIDDLGPNTFTFNGSTPANGSAFIGNNQMINLSITDLFSSIDTCLLELDNSTAVVNYSMTKSGSGLSVTCANLSIATSDDVTYKYRVWANDSLGNLNVSVQRQFTDSTLLATAANISLNGTFGDRIYYQRDSINITAFADTAGLNVSIWANFSGSLQLLQSGPTRTTNITNADRLGIGHFLVRANVTGNATHANSSSVDRLLIVKNLLALEILQPTVSQPRQNALPGQAFNVTINVTYRDAELGENVTWNLTVGGQDCLNMSLYGSSAKLWNVTCIAPAIGELAMHNITAIGTYTTQSVAANATAANAVAYGDATRPTINNITKSNVQQGNNATLEAYITDNGNVTLVTANITYPNSSTVSYQLSNISANLSAGTWRLTLANLTAIGIYDANITANDSNGNVVSNATWFSVFASQLNFSGIAKDVDNATVNVSVEIYLAGRPHTSNYRVANASDSNGTYNASLFSGNFDIDMRPFNHQIELKNVSVTSDVVNAMRFDAPGAGNASISGTRAVQVILAVSSTLAPQSLNLTLNFSNTSYAAIASITVYKCANWTFSNRSCPANNWTEINATLNTSAKTIMAANRSSFSAYAAAEKISCGDSVCDATESSATCPADCGSSGAGASGSGSGGGSSVTTGGGGGQTKTTCGNGVCEANESACLLDCSVGISATPTEMAATLTSGTSKTYHLTLSNLLNASVQVTLSVSDGLKKAVRLSSSAATIGPFSSISIGVYVDPSGLEPGLRQGYISVMRNGKEERISLSLLLSAESRQQDYVSIAGVPSEAEINGSLNIKVSAYGTADEGGTAKVLVRVLDQAGRAAYSAESAHSFVAGRLDAERSIDLRGLPKGKYTVLATVAYGSKVIEGTASFDIFDPAERSQLALAALAIVLLAMLIVAGRAALSYANLGKAKKLLAVSFRQAGIAAGRDHASGKVVYISQKHLAQGIGIAGPGARQFACRLVEQLANSRMKTVVFTASPAWLALAQRLNEGGCTAKIVENGETGADMSLVLATDAHAISASKDAIIVLDRASIDGTGLLAGRKAIVVAPDISSAAGMLASRKPVLFYIAGSGQESDVAGVLKEWRQSMRGLRPGMALMNDTKEKSVIALHLDDLDAYAAANTDLEKYQSLSAELRGLEQDIALLKRHADIPELESLAGQARQKLAALDFKLATMYLDSAKETASYMKRLYGSDGK
ncbi:MAG: hypothetical protein HY519_03985, partial [Candidatus Aenigmarchaeota archaeon]|nr:hypothetical protein [Candidatus Aenigmarchaeota archaeon]